MGKVFLEMGIIVQVLKKFLHVLWNPKVRCRVHTTSSLLAPALSQMNPVHIFPTYNSVVCSPQANYTDRATSACRRSYCQLLRIEGVTWSAQRIPSAVNLGFLDWSRYFLEIAHHFSSRGWVDPVPDPLLLRKSGSAGNRTWDLWICIQELWPPDHRGGPC
jgi:hypothetical protein